MNTRKVGHIGENIAEKYLKSKGYNTLCVNYYCKYGEIDIISCKDKYIIFVEVKMRKSNLYSTPAQAVNTKKQKKIINSALDYIVNNNVELQPRFDVIEIIKNEKDVKINHIINAFWQEEDNASF